MNVGVTREIETREHRRGTRRIAIIAGDGIGPEVIEQARLLLDWHRTERGLPLELWDLDLGADRYLRDGTTLPANVLTAIETECSALLIGALGDPRVPGHDHARDILFGVRSGLDLYVNLRPVRALSDRLVPLRGRHARDVDFVVLRENTEGAYAGIGGQLHRGTPDEVCINEEIHTRKGVQRIIEAAFDYARTNKKTRVHMADKSNAIPHAHGLWLRVFDEVGAQYPEIERHHLYIDALCLRLIEEPSEFQVIVTSNLFGDIVTDLGAALQGGLGMAASANLRPDDPEHVAMFEPVHGSAPSLAGKNVANPFAALRTVSMLLSHLGWPDEATRVERVVAQAIELRQCTPDVGGTLGTRAAGEWVRRALEPAT